MKITIYELLGLVKDGKAPKKIKYKNKIYEYDGEMQNYCRPINFTAGLLIGEDITSLLDDEVEIIEEEPKKIEKIDEILMIDDLIPPYQENEYKVWKNIIIQQNKINKLIDEINKLKE